MERWLLIAFQAGHVCRSVGETLLTIHEVLTHGSINGSPAFAQRGPHPKASSQDGATREVGEGDQGGELGQNRDNTTKARGGSGRHSGGDASDEQAKEELKGNGQMTEPEALDTLLQSSETGTAI